MFIRIEMDSLKKKLEIMYCLEKIEYWANYKSR